MVVEGDCLALGRHMLSINLVEDVMEDVMEANSTTNLSLLLVLFCWWSIGRQWIVLVCLVIVAEHPWE